uniref:Uncharacterized protein n=1 Tax=Arundo donax TaxID=35708 RepID=A0A0A9AGK0_ARUDO
MEFIFLVLFFFWVRQHGASAPGRAPAWTAARWPPRRPRSSPSHPAPGSASPAPAPALRPVARAAPGPPSHRCRGPLAIHLLRSTRSSTSPDPSPRSGPQAPRPVPTASFRPDRSAPSFSTMPPGPRPRPPRHIPDLPPPPPTRARPPAPQSRWIRRLARRAHTALPGRAAGAHDAAGIIVAAGERVICRRGADVGQGADARGALDGMDIVLGDAMRACAVRVATGRDDIAVAAGDLPHRGKGPMKGPGRPRSALPYITSRRRPT